MDELSEASLLAAMQQHLTRLGTALHDAVTETELPATQAMVPRDTETLADSAQVSAPVVDGSGVTVVLSYGRTDDRNPKTHEPSATYAIDVHERVDIAHPTGSAKYLEVPFMDHSGTLLARVAAKM